MLPSGLVFFVVDDSVLPVTGSVFVVVVSALPSGLVFVVSVSVVWSSLFLVVVSVLPSGLVFVVSVSFVSPSLGSVVVLAVLVDPSGR